MIISNGNLNIFYSKKFFFLFQVKYKQRIKGEKNHSILFIKFSEGKENKLIENYYSATFVGLILSANSPRICNSKSLKSNKFGSLIGSVKPLGKKVSSFLNSLKN